MKLISQFTALKSVETEEEAIALAYEIDRLKNLTRKSNEHIQLLAIKEDLFMAYHQKQMLELDNNNGIVIDTPPPAPFKTNVKNVCLRDMKIYDKASELFGQSFDLFTFINSNSDIALQDAKTLAKICHLPVEAILY